MNVFSLQIYKNSLKKIKAAILSHLKKIIPNCILLFA